MNTEADYDFMKAVYADLVVKTTDDHHPWYRQCEDVNKAFSQVRARLFTINLNLRGELPLPQELTDKIYHEALMSELKEKLPAFKKFRWDSHRGKDYYEERVFPDYWINICWALRGATGRYVRDFRGTLINKKAYLIERLNENGVVCDKKWTVDRLVKAL